MELTNKQMLLLVIGLGCFLLATFGSKNIPFTEFLPAIGGGAYALNFLTNLAK